MGFHRRRRRKGKRKPSSSAAASSLPASHWPREHRGRAGDRAVRALDPLAADLQFPKSLDTIYGGGEFFADRVSKLTDGKFTIRVFAAGDIVPAFQALDAVQQGTVEICHTATYYYVGKDFTMGFGTALPFGLTTRQQNAWMYRGRRHRHAERVLQGVRRHRLPGRQHRRADGRLVPQPGQHASPTSRA